MFCVLLLVGAAATADAQATRDTLSLDRIFRSAEFAAEWAPTIVWLKDGRSWLTTRDDSTGLTIVRVTGSSGAEQVLARGVKIPVGDGKLASVEDVTLSPDETHALLRHSSKAVAPRYRPALYHVLDFGTGRLTPLSKAPGLQDLAKFSPNGSKVAFFRDGNLFVTDLASGDERQLTRDGNETILNGSPDWSYEEEFQLSDAFRWSPDGSRIAFLRFDQTLVPKYPILREVPMTPTVVWSHYPRPGEALPRVTVGVVRVEGGDSITWLDVSADDQYLPRMDWAGNDSVTVQRLPRKQNRVDVLMASTVTGKTRTMLSEADSAFIDIESGTLQWIRGGKQFLWLSDASGWRQIYLHDRSGKRLAQLTRDGMDVIELAGVNEEKGFIYVAAAGPQSTEQNYYGYPLDGRGAAVRVTRGDGVHDLTIGPGAHWAVVTSGDRDTPPRASFVSFPDMRVARVLFTNDAVKAKLRALGLPRSGRLAIATADGTVLDGWRIVPVDFDSTRRYPVIMTMYGGPSAPSARNEYQAFLGLINNWMANHGFVIVTVDNRGAAWRGRAFRKSTYGRLGAVESDDQIAVARWLARQPWADESRIGIWGISFGGYLSAMSAMRGGNAFRAAADLSGVSDWRLYDAPYSERYMGLPAENIAGYAATSLMTYADSVSTRLLIAHTTADDNVHAQHAYRLIEKLAAARKDFSVLMYPDRGHANFGPAMPHMLESLLRFFLESMPERPAL